MAGVTFKKLAVAHNAASVSAGNAILAAVVAPQTGLLHIGFAVTTGTTVQLGVYNGTDTVLIDLVAASAIQNYTFTWPAISGYSYSLINKTASATATTVPHAVLLLQVPIG